MNDVECECGELSGGRCGLRGPRAAMVRIDYVPGWLRAAADEIGDRGLSAGAWVLPGCAAIAAEAWEERA